MLVSSFTESLSDCHGRNCLLWLAKTCSKLGRGFHMLLTQKLQLILQVCVSLVWICLLLYYV